MVREDLQKLYKIGVPYATIARLARVDRSTVSKFANGGKASMEVAIQIQKAVDKFKEEVANV